MNKSLFHYELPPELIAQEPIEPRDASRLLVMGRETGSLEDRRFADLPSLLRPGDCLILNDSRVLPARLEGRRADTGTPVELLLLRPAGEGLWETLAGPGRRARPGHRLMFGDGELEAEIVDIAVEGNRLVRFSHEGSFYSVIEKLGRMPLPPYIHKTLEDGERYQTVYARDAGSAAAPTAGLHFTPALLGRLREMGVGVGFVTLHVGLGTFRPVKEDDITRHVMHAEHYTLPPETADLINRTKAAGRRVIAVGTTSCRSLESAALQTSRLESAALQTSPPESAALRCSAPAGGTLLRPAEGWTDIFIYPGYQFQVLDGLLTNFHLPESTLIMLVSAFAGRENTLAAYARAVEERYRFFSFGDAMLIL